MKKLFAGIVLALAVSLAALPALAANDPYFTQLVNTVAFTNPSTSSSNAALSAATVTVPLPTLRIVNGTDKTVYVKQGIDNTVAAAATDLPILAGGTAYISANSTLRYVAVLAAASSTGLVYFTLGAGK